MSYSRGYHVSNHVSNSGVVSFSSVLQNIFTGIFIVPSRQAYNTYSLYSGTGVLYTCAVVCGEVQCYIDNEYYGFLFLI